MAKNKKQTKQEDGKYTYEQLFMNKNFNQKYQKDLAKVVLKDKLYTVEEAKTILNKFFKKGA